MTTKKLSIYLLALAMPFALMSCSDNSTGVIDDDDDGDNGGNGGVTEVIEFPITFEQDIPWEDFITNFEGGELSVVDNPDPSGINTTDKVAMMVKGEGEVFAGSVVLLAENIDFTDGAAFTFSVWAPRANTKMLFKIENEEDASQAFEREITIAESQEWVDVTFDLSGANQTFDYKKLVFIFDLGTAGDGSEDFTWYFDNIRQVEGDGGNGGGGEALTLPVDFEDETVDYGLTDFAGAASEIVADPTDATNNVVQTIKTASAETFAGTTLGGTVGFDNPIPFTSGETTMSVRVWSPTAGTPVRLKVEDAGDPTISVETETSTTVDSEWETLVFDFSNEATGTAALNLASNYNLATIFFNFGTTGGEAGEQTYYWDDVEFGGESDGGGNGGGGNAVVELPLSFEEDIPWNDFITNFEGGDLSVVDNPDQTGNTSAKVARMIKGSGAVFAGSIITLSDNIDFTAGTDFTVSVWTPRPDTKMLFKIENENDGGQFYEQELTIAESQEWVDITFDMSGANQANTYKKLVFIFDNGTTGDGSADFTWYFDDLTQSVGDGGDGGGGGGDENALSLPVTFDDESLDYALTDFGGNESVIVDDPTDATNKVAQSTKTAGAELWAGTTVGGDAGFGEPIPFANGATTMSVRVWSPTAGTPIRLKVEDSGDPTISVETEAVTTVDSEWETLVFDFSNEATGTAALNLASNYNKASIFFNFGTTGGEAGEQTYYWDDMEFGDGQ